MNARHAVIAAALATLALSASPEARADEVVDSRYGFAPYVGGGGAFLGRASPLPSPVALTQLGAEIMGELPPWGGFFRTDYLSSGQDGRWTAISFALGGSYRLLGQPRHLSLLARGGFSYQYWHGSSSGCDVLVFVPNSCIAMGAPAMMGTVTVPMPVTTYSGNAFGLYLGARLELPVSPVYLALDANALPDIAVGTQNPSAILGLTVDLVVGLRDVHRSGSGDVQPQPVSRSRHGL